jgi:hypothetical protein
VESQPPVSVFISHSHHDSKFVRMLAEDLRAMGVSTWAYEDEVRPGDNFVMKLGDGLAGATHVLVVLSPHSLTSAWVREEICAAQINSFHKDVRLIPLLLGDVETRDIPVLLGSRLHVDFRQPGKYKEQLHWLLWAFEATSAAPPREVQGRPCIEAMNVLQPLGAHGRGLEVYLANRSAETFSIRQVLIHHYHDRTETEALREEGPPIYRYQISMRVAPLPSAPGDGGSVRLDLRGHAREPSDDWGRTIEGLVDMDDDGYVEAVIVSPMYCEVRPRASVIIRLILDEVRVASPSWAVGSLGGRGHESDSNAPDLATYLESAPLFGRCHAWSGRTGIVFMDHEGEHVAGILMDDSMHQLFYEAGQRMWSDLSGDGPG